MTIGMIFFCYRKRHQTRDGDGNESDRKRERRGQRSLRCMV